MATHPYISGHGNITQAVNHFRSSFPKTVTADTLKQLGIAPNNESYLISILRFVGLLDAEGKKTDVATKTFSQHQDEAFAKSFGELVKDAYKGLFDLHGDKAWELGVDALITFFRSSDDTSAVIGGRQAQTFRALAGLAGHAGPKETRATAAKKPSNKATPTKRQSAKPAPAEVHVAKPDAKQRDLGLTVRVEINLPADGDQETYDRIFKSIRENLLNGG